MKEQELKEIPQEKFILTPPKQRGESALKTAPVGYFKDAFRRFQKNKGAMVAAVVLGVLLLFAVFGPFLTPYSVEYKDVNFQYCYPKSRLSEKLGWNFWDGCVKKSINARDFTLYRGIYEETGKSPVKGYRKRKYKRYLSVDGKEMYQIRFDTYRASGVVLLDIGTVEYKDLQRYQDENDKQVIYPATNKKVSFATGSEPTLSMGDQRNYNYWYKTQVVEGKTEPILDGEGKFIPDYLPVSYDRKGGRTDGYFSGKKIEQSEEYAYARPIGKTGRWHVRVDNYEYYIYYHTQVLKDGIEKPLFLFGTTQDGQDIFTRLSSGARFSFVFALVTSLVNMLIGAIYGAIEGYYGGVVDLTMERIADILGAIPFLIVITLLKMHFGGGGHLPILFIAFFLSGWMGMAGTVRMQFYRFKNQEYVLAARTLGASDRRIMLRHIFPNALGTIVTRSVLYIPSMIFSESSLSYLGIINLDSGRFTSVGSMLAGAQTQMQAYPYMMLFPALFISLLMLSFNLLGNGLRDAFNPTLRGGEN